MPWNLFPLFRLTRRNRINLVLNIAAAAFLAARASGQTAACPAQPAHAAIPAETAYNNADYAQAERLYAQAVAQQPHDTALSAGLVRTLLQEGKFAEASAAVNAIAPEDQHSAAALTALADVQYRQGQPWLATKSLDAAVDADPCYARAHLIRSRIFRIDSMYASERAEVQKAYDIDPTDPDILTAFQRLIAPAREIDGIDKSLATAKDIDPEVRKKAEDSMHSMLPLLTENSQTCKVLPADPSATLPLLASMEDGKHTDGYRIEVQLPKTKAKLELDTAASGLYISKALADENGLQRAASAPEGTVQAESVRIGSLEFHDCMVGVSEAPFAGKVDGFIGADIFASWLITLDFRNARMTLDPLPAQAGVLPPDRSVPPELAGYLPVYHRRHYLLLPVGINEKSRGLFVLDSGMRFGTMTPEMAHTVSNIKVNFTNPMQTASGPPLQIYRDNFDLQFANLSLTHQNRIVQLDPSNIDRNAGFQIAGMLGFDMLRSLTMHLDYRDGLVKFESADPEVSPLHANRPGPGDIPAPPPCPPDDTRVRSIMTTLQARVTSGLDSAHLKPGKEIWLNSVNEWTDPDCTIPEKAVLYGHVTAASSTKNPNSAELAMVFDHADCVGHSKKQITLRLIGIVTPSGGSDSSHDAAPAEVSGGARSISATSAGTNGYDAKLNLPANIRPGDVLGIDKVKLEPQGGPACSSRLSGPVRSIQIEPGSELLFAAY